VDNNSNDNTKEIAREFTSLVFNKGPERSAQRNFGVSKATGEYVMIIDSDMELGKRVVEQCVEKFATDRSIVGLVIPEESFGKGFWAKCKQLERSYYVGVPWMEAARAFRRKIYQRTGGYNESMVSGEDWDLSQRVAELGTLGRIDEFIHHNEGHLKLKRTLQKKYYYAQKFAAYSSQSSSQQNLAAQTGVLSRYKLYFSKPGRLFRNPAIGAGMLFMKTAELGFGAVGMMRARSGKGGA
jgi:glycosyltransferase involved in cell wall biosynthesis